MENKIILNFIFKDEADVLYKMLFSTKDIIDYIVAIDTGSSDNSTEIIKNFAEEYNIPCYIKYSEFINFGKSRNEALDYAHDVIIENNLAPNKTYLYWMDCDEILTIEDTFDKNNLNSKSYTIDIIYGSTSYRRNSLIRMDSIFKWVGPVHEFIESNDVSKFNKSLKVIVFQCGASWKGSLRNKYKTHAELLINEIESNPNGRYVPRWLFYVAQSYFDAAMADRSNIDFKLLKKAKKYYKMRCMSDGYRDEKFWSKYRLGIISNLENDKDEIVRKNLIDAYIYDTRRIEPLFYYMELLMSKGQYSEAFIYASLIYNEYKTPPTNVLFSNTYNYSKIEYLYNILKESVKR